MKKLIHCLFATMLFCCGGYNSNAQPKSEPEPHTLLWKISGNGLRQPSWLFGTMHVLCSSDAVLSDSLQQVISTCDSILFEIKLDDMAGMMASLKYMRMNDEQKLSDLLSPEDYLKVKNYFAQHIALLPFSILERFKPLLISSLIEEQSLACESTNGMEMVIMQKAKQSDKKIGGLETASYQASLFDSIPYKKQAKDLVDAIDSAGQNNKTTSELVKVYREQDLSKIDELTRNSDPTMNGYLDLLLFGRNRNWAGKMPGLMKEKSLLFAVGAGHLPGEKGLITLLRKMGYSVTPVKN